MQTQVTKRQLQVIAGLARGHSDEQIGERLGISPASVNAHLQRIAKRLRARNQVDIVAIAYRRGWMRGLTPEPRAIGPLPARQWQVLEGLSRGLTKAEIAQELFVTHDTVRTHTGRLFRALGVHDAPHAVAIAYQHGLLSTPANTMRSAA